MALRIHDSVIRGEIDNRVKGIVRGKIWLHKRKEPFLLRLKGNPCPDIAGCLLKFANPHKSISHHGLKTLSRFQIGQVGDISASRKVREFDLPIEEAYKMIKRGKRPSEHMANSFYLEWFSIQNGRVVIESTDYQLEISAPEWRMTPEENDARAKQSAEGMDWFMQKISEAIEEQKRGQKDPE